MAFLSLFYLNVREQLIEPKYDIIKYKKQNRNKKLRHIIHIDMDCYFVSITTRNKPELQTKPYVVGDSNQSKEYQNKNKSSNLLQNIQPPKYHQQIARKFGIKTGMVLGKALKLCPNVIVLQYKLDDYVTISEKIYEMFFNYSNMIQYKSIDETFIELAMELNDISIIDIANAMRKDIFDAIECPCSAGISDNFIIPISYATQNQTELFI